MRDGGYYPALLEPRRRGERALVAVVQEAYVQGVSTRRVDDLVKALGMSGISKSQVSRLCQALDIEVERFRTRKLGKVQKFRLREDAASKARTSANFHSRSSKQVGTVQLVGCRRRPPDFNC